MPTLRPYQQQLDQDIDAAFSAGARDVLAVAATGSGKTVLFSHTIQKRNCAAVAIAHRQELVSQISLSLARNQVRHRIIGSSSVTKNIVSIHMADGGRSYYDANARTAAAGVDTLIRMPAGDPFFNQVAYGVMDECFPAGTLIDGVPIERLKIGDIVTAFDEKTGRLEKRPVTCLFKNPAPSVMVKLTMGNHHALNCTSGHPFYTRNGWKNAADLTTDDEVLLYELHAMQRPDYRDERGATIPVSKDRPHILQSQMRIHLSGHEQKTPSETGITNSPLHHLPSASGFERPQIRSVETNGAGVLLDGLFNDLSCGDFIENRVQDKPETRLATHDRKQPHAPDRDPRKNGANAQSKRAPTENSRGQRTTPNTGRSDTMDVIRVDGVCPTTEYQNRDASELRIPAGLQTRYGALGDENSDRGRRDESWGPAPSGRQERCPLKWIRVDSVTIYKRGNSDTTGDCCRDGYVYNIEVAELHTYIANGIVVHNCHHVLRSNKWGRARAMFPNAQFLHVTATPVRADGCGLGRHADGFIDAMVMAPTMRDLINMGYLTDYRIICAESHIALTEADISNTTGDFNQQKVRDAVHEAKITGDIVREYLRWAPGKLGVTFAVDVEHATEIAVAFRAAGIPAEVVSAKTPDHLRMDILRRFKRREILQLVNVDLFGEGFDLPAIEVVSFGRPTASWALYCQQFGRVLRLMLDPSWMGVWDSLDDAGRRAAIAASNKPVGMIIDHVGNVVRHMGPPDRRVEFTLDRRERKAKTVSDAIPYRHCTNPNANGTGLPCAMPYERVHKTCPYCGFYPEPAVRSAPEFVDGNLVELDAATRAALWGEIARIDGAARYPANADTMVRMAINKRHEERKQAQGALRLAMAWYSGLQDALGRPDVEEKYSRFFHQFGVDTATAQAYGVSDAEKLRVRICDYLQRYGVDGTVNNA